ncbi:ABC-2 family transporter protein [Halobacteriovorax sp. HLS]|uniref:ABC transporter permease n=1 Tax=Halobacteriovorax sp. HLS TaxID=2234000 RepID=UPI000FD7AC81|nr:ABC-2 family transporter protein [Halobacteriovorax sp. HLS]
MNNFSKWIQTMKISWSQLTAYRLNFFLQVIGPSIVFFFIKYNLWSSIYAGDQEQLISGYNFKQMITYHSWNLIVSLIAGGYASHNLAEDIRLGRISSYLIYPFNFWEFHTASFLSFQLLQTFISFVTIGMIALIGIIELPSFSFLFQGYVFCFIVSLMWFTLQYLTGILSFWLEETWILRVILQITAAFLSGAILPLELYPKWFVDILNYTPFPYLSYYPIKVFTGEFSLFSSAPLVIIGWMAIFILINKFIWNRGMKLYTAAGM